MRFSLFIFAFFLPFGMMNVKFGERVLRRALVVANATSGKAWIEIKPDALFQLWFLHRPRCALLLELRFARV